MKVKFSLAGALVGGVACAVLRAAFTYYNFIHAADTEDIARGMLGFLALFPSAGIGLLCGAIAGSTGRVELGALLGAVLSVGIFGLFVLPFAFCFSLVEADTWLAEFTWVYFVQKGFAGAIGGAVGGFVGGRVDAEVTDRDLINARETGTDA